MADERMGLDTEEQRRRHHAAQLAENMLHISSATLNGMLEARELRGEARGRAAVLAELGAELRHHAGTGSTITTSDYVRGLREGLLYAVKRVEARAHAAGVAALEER